VGCARSGIWGVILENLICGYGIVFICATDAAIESGRWGMGGVIATAKTHRRPQNAPIRTIEVSVRDWL
jgi:hypothetical protein